MASKELFLWCVVLVWVSDLTQADPKAPVVQVYSRHPVTHGKENVLHCYAENFHPPKINVTLLKNNVKLANVKQSDLSFKEDWTFQLLTYATVVPNGNDEYLCVVDHQALDKPVTVKWEQDH
ncbi:beta-2-microglobulin [Python bivittatus]|uniref:Beta-2-microglobulin n=1 Tax=Python bivittatus TaxID=176946 RepID=A0A9F2N8F3_PYTBI|nr:beta-2-microglobulin [Python bivittatus]